MSSQTLLSKLRQLEELAYISGWEWEVDYEAGEVRRAVYYETPKYWGEQDNYPGDPWYEAYA